MRLLFLGTGAGCGVPSFYCDCLSCREARDNREWRRSRCSIALLGDEITLVDAPPELRTQLIRENILHIDRLILTHWHYDHFGGLGDLEFFVRMKRETALPAAMSSPTLRKFQHGFDFMGDCLLAHEVEHGSSWEFDNMTCLFLEAQHCEGSLGLLFQHQGRRTAYFPDSGPLPERTFQILKGLDTLIFDATFWGENWMEKQHQSVESAISTGRELGAEHIILTHLSMHYDQPVSMEELNQYLERWDGRVSFAFDGLTISL